MNYMIFEKNLSALIKRLDRLSKRSVKIGGEPITFHVTGASKQEAHPTDAGKLVRLVEVEVTGTAPYYNGWHFMATICATQEGNVIRAIPGYEVPNEYREGSHTCDHCHTNRRRNDTYIVRHDSGETKRVGSTCLQEFLGYLDANKLSAAAICCIQAYDVAEAATKSNWLGGAGREIFRYDLLTYLSWVAQVVIENKRFITRKAADLDGTQATSVFAERLMMHGYSEQFGLRYVPTDAAKIMAEEAREWVICTYAPAIIDNDEATSDFNLKDSILEHHRGIVKELNDFEHNLLTVARSEAIEPRLKGIAAYIIEAYRREQRRINPVQSAQLNSRGLTKIFAMIETAKTAKLKNPKIRLVDENKNYLTLTLAGTASKNAGFIYVKGRTSDTYFGKISPEGKFFPAGICPTSVEAQLLAFANNPEEVASKYGKLTGSCCFCGLALTDERSTHVGYGPICARKFGLRWGAHEAVKVETTLAAQPALA